MEYLPIYTAGIFGTAGSAEYKIKANEPWLEKINEKKNLETPCYSR